MTLKRGQVVMFVNVQGVHKAWVFDENSCSGEIEFVGELENVPQGIGSNGRRRLFMKEQAARFGLEALPDHAEYVYLLK